MARVDRAARVAKSQRGAEIGRGAWHDAFASRVGRWVVSSPTQWLSIVPGPLAPWAGRDGEGRSDSKGGEGQRGARRSTQPARGASRAPTGPLGRQLTDTMVEHQSLVPSPPWAGRDGEGRSGSQGWRRASEGRQSTSLQRLLFENRAGRPKNGEEGYHMLCTGLYFAFMFAARITLPHFSVSLPKAADESYERPLSPVADRPPGVSFDHPISDCD
jgi:hypothetical protein